ncbi:MAG: 50S ribosomal protein L28 [Chloroflexota bacterium]
MMTECYVCGKGPQYGQNILHPHSGQWALRAPRTKRRWMPNLQTAHIAVNGDVKKVRVCTRCLKAGKVQRAAL